jgi:hypothetical protein
VFLHSTGYKLQVTRYCLESTKLRRRGFHIFYCIATEYVLAGVVRVLTWKMAESEQQEICGQQSINSLHPQLLKLAACRLRARAHAHTHTHLSEQEEVTSAKVPAEVLIIKDNITHEECDAIDSMSILET